MIHNNRHCIVSSHYRTLNDIKINWLPVLVVDAIAVAIALLNNSNEGGSSNNRQQANNLLGTVCDGSSVGWHGN